MRIIITVFALISGLFASNKVYGQVTVDAETGGLLTQHWAVPTLLDPAATGDIDFIRVRAGARLDYLGSHDSPKNFFITGDSPFKVGGKRIGAGIIASSITYDLFSNYSIGAQGSYKFNLKKNILSVGIQIGYFHTSFKGSELTLTPGGNENNTPEGGINDDLGEEEQLPEDNYDSRLDWPTQDVAGGALDLGVGIRFTHPKFHVGISGLHLTNAKIRLSKDGEENSGLRYIQSTLPTTMYFDAGGNIAIKNSLISLQPSLLIGTDFSDFTALVEMRATYNGKVTFGIDYRYNRAFGALAGLNLKDFYIGYSWEYDYSRKPRGSTGNHELVIGYRFKLDLGDKNTFSHRSIRIM